MDANETITVFRPKSKFSMNVTFVKILMYRFMLLQSVLGFPPVLHSTGDIYQRAVKKKDESNFQMATRTFGHFYIS